MNSGNRHTSNRRELIILFGGAASAAAAFIVLSAIVWHVNAPVGLDRDAAELGIVAGKEGPLGNHPRMARAAEWLGSRTGVGLTTAALVGLALLWRDWLAAFVAFVAPVTCFVLTEYIAKPLINHPAPFGSRAFPSGHAAGVTAVAVSAVMLLYRRWGGLAAAAFAPVAVAAVISGGLGVLALGLHEYPTEILGGAALGSTVVLTLAAVLSLLIAARRTPLT